MRLLAELSSRLWLASIIASVLHVQSVKAIPLQIDNEQSIKDAAAIAAKGMMQYYNADVPGVGVPGNLPDPYYWWHAGAMMMSLIEYWSLTGDDSYNRYIREAIQHQAGPAGDFMVENQTRTTGNDDQAFWAFAALSAAELKFPNPPADQFSWLSLAQGCFNTQVARWNAPPAACGGGLRWQVFTFNPGYNYKNMISNGCFFSLGARLARYTGNMTYAEQADKAWDWMWNVNLITPEYAAFDGADTTNNCTDPHKIEWTYNAGVLLHGAANLWNISTNDADRQKWRTRVDGLLDRMYKMFFREEMIMSNFACEEINTCNLDMSFFKGFGARWMAATAQLCPWTHDPIMERLRASAQAAAKQCSGPDNACGLHWIDQSQYDGQKGVGMQLSAMSVFSNLLIKAGQAPLTHDTGGDSKSNPNAGGRVSDNDALHIPGPATAADKAGAGILTTLLAIATVGGAGWLVI